MHWVYRIYSVAVVTVSLAAAVATMAFALLWSRWEWDQHCRFRDELNNLHTTHARRFDAMRGAPDRELWREAREYRRAVVDLYRKYHKPLPEWTKHPEWDEAQLPSEK